LDFAIAPIQKDNYTGDAVESGAGGGVRIACILSEIQWPKFWLH
jgi:hypothetical protein